jgi:cob(I)alamin adenosyltransferase
LAAAEDRDTENLPQLSDDAISKLETEIDTVNESLSELTSFVLPGGSVINAQFHMARNVCRRAERRTVTLSRNETVVPENIRYLNRLSDALFVWSRWVSHILGDTENFWNPNH